jgi:hypothetical protein
LSKHPLVLLLSITELIRMKKRRPGRIVWSNSFKKPRHIKEKELEQENKNKQKVDDLIRTLRRKATEH